MKNVNLNYKNVFSGWVKPVIKNCHMESKIRKENDLIKYKTAKKIERENMSVKHVQITFVTLKLYILNDC